MPITNLTTGKKYKNLFDYYTDWKNCKNVKEAYKRLEMLQVNSILKGKDWHLNKKR